MAERLKFDPANPPRRKEVCHLEVNGEHYDHTVCAVQIGIIDDVLEQVSRIFDFDPKGDVGEQIRESYQNYPTEFITALSKLTGYAEEDIKSWGIDLTEEIALDWVNCNYRFAMDAWGKKKGILGELGKEEIKEETVKEKQKKEPLLESQGNPSGA